MRRWVAQAEIDDGARPGVTSVEAEEIRRLKTENKRLREANETSHAVCGQAAVVVWVGKAACSL